jgi:hypothetical protein
MGPDHVATFLIKLVFWGPVLYVALLMTIDPARVVRLPGMLIRGLNNFEHRLLGFHWQERLREPEEANASKRTRIGLRFSGLLLAAWALLSLVVSN